MSNEGTPWERSKAAWQLSFEDGWKDERLCRMWFSAVGKGIINVTDAFEAVQKDGAKVTEIRVRPGREGKGYLVIVKALFEGNKIIGFHAAPTVQEALAEVGGKLKNGALKWREDLPYDPDKVG